MFVKREAKVPGKIEGDSSSGSRFFGGPDCIRLSYQQDEGLTAS